MTEQVDVNALLTQGIKAAREKRREEARNCLLQVIDRDPNVEQAWLWLSGVVDDPRDMQIALANALTINPGNEPARKGLEMLRQRYGDLLAEEEAAAPAPPVAPAATDREEGVEFPCYSCKSIIYDVASFCWNCHAVVRCCENCTHRRETACKEQAGIRGPAASVSRNSCQYWTPG